jgi:hypothetical protein
MFEQSHTSAAHEAIPRATGSLCRRASSPGVGSISLNTHYLSDCFLAYYEDAGESLFWSAGKLSIRDHDLANLLPPDRMVPALELYISFPFFLSSTLT